MSKIIISKREALAILILIAILINISLISSYSPRPIPCTDLDIECGVWSDGVGGTVDCGSCDPRLFCTGDGMHRSRLICDIGKCVEEEVEMCVYCCLRDNDNCASSQEECPCPRGQRQCDDDACVGLEEQECCENRECTNIPAGKHPTCVNPICTLGHTCIYPSAQRYADVGIICEGVFDGVNYETIKVCWDLGQRTHH